MRIVHVVPFHESASVWFEPPIPARVAPTAMQNDVVVHDTPYSGLIAPVDGSDASDQVVPFHRSTIASGKEVDGSSYRPTAMQKVVLMHETLASWLLVVALASGLGTAVHVVPLNDSTSVCQTPVVVSVLKPTATQNVDVGHDTDCRRLSVPGSGVVHGVFVEAGGAVACCAPGGTPVPTMTAVATTQAVVTRSRPPHRLIARA